MTDRTPPPRTPMVKVCGLYENASKTTGDTFYVGYLGGAKVLILRNRQAKEGEPGWSMLIQERPAKPAGER